MMPQFSKAHDQTPAQFVSARGSRKLAAQQAVSWHFGAVLADARVIGHAHQVEHGRRDIDVKQVLVPLVAQVFGFLVGQRTAGASIQAGHVDLFVEDAEVWPI